MLQLPKYTTYVHMLSVALTICCPPTLPPLLCCRAYVQPQWVFDCVNRHKLLPTGEYCPGSLLPPHLSPFVEEGDNEYVPPERMAQEEEDQQDAAAGGVEGGHAAALPHSYTCWDRCPVVLWGSVRWMVQACTRSVPDTRTGHAPML